MVVNFSIPQGRDQESYNEAKNAACTLWYQMQLMRRNNSPEVAIGDVEREYREQLQLCTAFRGAGEQNGARLD